MLESQILIWGVLGVVGFFTFLFILSRFYRRASKEISFVKTGMGGEKVILDGGAIIWPVFQQLTQVNMRTLRLQVDRKNEEGLITADRMRVDVTAEFYVRVKPEREAIAKAAQTLGNRTLQPDTLKELLQGKFVDALRSVAAGLSMEQLHERRAEFVQSVQESVSEDLLKNGLELESVSLTALDQTAREYFKEDNAFDAQGLAKLTYITEAKREERNRIEQETRVSIELKNLDAEKQSLDIKRDEEFAGLNQRRDVEVAKADQESLVAKQRALRMQEAEQAQIEATLKVKTAQIESDQSVEEREIGAKRRVEEADIERKKAVDISHQNADIIVAKKSEEKSKAEADAAVALSEKVKNEEEVVTVRSSAIAEREKKIRLIKAREEAEREAIDVTVQAEAEKKAAVDRAESVLTQAKAEAERIRIVAEADEKRFEVEAYGERAINEAKNILDETLMQFELRKIIAQVAPQILEATVKPMEAIDSIKIIQTNGFGVPGSGGSGAGANGNGASSGSVPNQLMEAALGYRMNLPLVEKLLGVIGLKSDSPEGMTESLGNMIKDDSDDSSKDEKSADPNPKKGK